MLGIQHWGGQSHVDSLANHLDDSENARSYSSEPTNHLASNQGCLSKLRSFTPSLELGCRSELVMHRRLPSHVRDNPLGPGPRINSSQVRDYSSLVKDTSNPIEVGAPCMVP